MSTEHLEPAKSAIAKAGGVDIVSSITGKHVSRVYRWMYSKERGGTGGRIPQDEADKMLRYSKDNNLGLSPADFFLSEFQDEEPAA